MGQIAQIYDELWPLTSQNSVSAQYLKLRINGWNLTKVCISIDVDKI